jgi:NAD(P)-dependent dehydrogenase (short-subunit alcohol dehydrogenase family)
MLEDCESARARVPAQVNMTAPVLLMRELVPTMKLNGWGRVIHISSIAAVGSTEGRHAYTGTKTALVGMTKTGALELGPHGITVNCILPGPFLTAMTLKNFDEEKRAFFAAKARAHRPWGSL